MHLTLPWPPSINHYWMRNRNGGVRVSAAGMVFRAHVVGAVGRVQPIRTRVAVSIVTHQRDRRRHDLDNLLKAVLDSLTHAGVYVDDSQVDDLRIIRGSIDREDPGIEVEMKEIECLAFDRKRRYKP